MFKVTLPAAAYEPKNDKLRDPNIMKIFITIKSLNHLAFKSVTDLTSCEIVIQIFKKK
jgi:hypothetical protein